MMSSPSDDAADPATSPRRPLTDYELLVIVSGGIAAYKTCTLVSRLVQRGAGVTVAMTESATRLVGPAAFQSLSARRVLTSLWVAEQDYDAQHIHVTERADVVVVAPATANLIGKLANGIADDLCSTLLASIGPAREQGGTPVLLAPTMNIRMWGSPFVQANLARLKEAGYEMIGPEEGWMACRTIGRGRMSEPEAILEHVTQMLSGRKPKNLSGGDRPLNS
jgi:phosphopantothenoylcysteine decarboxylase/phosphopantothenate--cysteine ligase